MLKFVHTIDCWPPFDRFVLHRDEIIMAMVVELWLLRGLDERVWVRSQLQQFVTKMYLQKQVDIIIRVTKLKIP